MLKKLFCFTIVFVLLSSILSMPNVFSNGGNWRTYYVIHPAKSITSNSALIEVQFIRGEKINDDITLPGYVYGVQYWKKEDPSNVRATYDLSSAGGGVYQASLNNLEPNTEYMYKGWGQISTFPADGSPEILSFKTRNAFLYGDINGDGNVNSTDYVLLSRYVLEVMSEFPTVDGVVAADLNGDGKIDSIDVVLFKRYILNIINRFPVEDKEKVTEKEVDEEINKDFLQGNSTFAFNIFKQLNKEASNRNVFISPFNISMALSMVYQGAGTSTKDEMNKVLGYEGIEISDINQSYKILIKYLSECDEKVQIKNSNSIWTNSKFDKVIKQEFISVNQDVFDALVESRDFSNLAVTDEINNWIREATEEKITQMLDSVDAGVLSYIISAIYFKGIWKEEFKPESTSTSVFKMEDGSTTNVISMLKKGKVEYGEGDGYKAVRLPYGNGKTSMYCILPDEDTPINNFIKDMNLTKWNEIKQSISMKDNVILQLPRFKIRYGSKDISEALKNLGMRLAFDEYNSDFSGMSEEIVFIEKVLHQAVIEVNEEGTEASAVTVITVRPSSGDAPKEYRFIADRPFVFVISDDEYGTILFMGKMTNID